MAEYAAKKTGPEVVNPERLVGRYQLTPNFVFDVNLKNLQLMVGITNQPTQEVFADSPTQCCVPMPCPQLLTRQENLTTGK